MKAILNKIDYEGRNLNLNYNVDNEIVYSGAREIELMEHQLRDHGVFLG